MEIIFTKQAWADYLHWIENDKKKVKKINRFISECEKTPLQGTGKPEPLKHDLSGLWSRRIDDFNRFIYSHDGNDTLTIIACRFHYDEKKKA